MMHLIALQLVYDWSRYLVPSIITGCIYNSIFYIHRIYFLNIGIQLQTLSIQVFA